MTRPSWPSPSYCLMKTSKSWGSTGSSRALPPKGTSSRQQKTLPGPVGFDEETAVFFFSGEKLSNPTYLGKRNNTSPNQSQDIVGFFSLTKPTIFLIHEGTYYGLKT